MFIEIINLIIILSAFVLTQSPTPITAYLGLERTFSTIESIISNVSIVALDKFITSNSNSTTQPNRSLIEGQVRILFDSKTDNVANITEQNDISIDERNLDFICDYNQIFKTIDRQVLPAAHPVLMVEDSLRLPQGFKSQSYDYLDYYIYVASVFGCLILAAFIFRAKPIVDTELRFEDFQFNQSCSIITISDASEDAIADAQQFSKDSLEEPSTSKDSTIDSKLELSTVDIEAGQDIDDVGNKLEVPDLYSDSKSHALAINCQEPEKLLMMPDQHHQISSSILHLDNSPVSPQTASSILHLDSSPPDATTFLPNPIATSPAPVATLSSYGTASDTLTSASLQYVKEVYPPFNATWLNPSTSLPFSMSAISSNGVKEPDKNSKKHVSIVARHECVTTTTTRLGTMKDTENKDNTVKPYTSPLFMNQKSSLTGSCTVGLRSIDLRNVELELETEKEKRKDNEDTNYIPLIGMVILVTQVMFNHYYK